MQRSRAGPAWQAAPPPTWSTSLMRVPPMDMTSSSGWGDTTSTRLGKGCERSGRLQGGRAHAHGCCELMVWLVGALGACRPSGCTAFQGSSQC